MKRILVSACVVMSLLAALPAIARISSNKLAANGVAVLGFSQGALVVRSVELADGTVVALN